MFIHIVLQGNYKKSILSAANVDVHNIQHKFINKSSAGYKKLIAEDDSEIQQRGEDVETTAAHSTNQV